MDPFNWTCPHCERHVTITEQNYSDRWHVLSIENADGRQVFASQFTVCPNPDCQKFTLTAQLHESKRITSARGMLEESLGAVRDKWSLVPSSNAKNFPSYIPQVLRDDYREACLIKDLSPKASATLSRRCLQGILRDFWKVKPGRLVDEIDEIKGKLDDATWRAIDAVRQLGNIGAHMKNDINVIVDVDPGEAKLLVELVETLFREWYVARNERETRMAAVVAAAKNKKTP